jgi:hypothetical protein
MDRSRLTDAQILGLLSDADEKPDVEVSEARNVCTVNYHTRPVREAGMTGVELREECSSAEEIARRKWPTTR